MTFCSLIDNETRSSDIFFFAYQIQGELFELCSLIFFELNATHEQSHVLAVQYKGRYLICAVEQQHQHL